MQNEQNRTTLRLCSSQVRIKALHPKSRKVLKYMKLNDEMIALLAQIEELKTPASQQLQDIRMAELGSNLWELYKTTDNIETVSLISQLMAEAGYPWFSDLADAESMQSRFSPQQRALLEMEPQNGYIH